MYKLRRVYRTKPGEATNVAKLVFKQAKMYKDAGHRGDFTVSYNGYTLPGEQNIVVLEVSDERSPQSINQYCEKTRQDISRKGVVMNNFVSLSLLEKLK